MNKEALITILDGIPGCKHTSGSKGDDFIVPADLELTFFAGRAVEGLTVARVTQVQLRAGHVGLDTARGEHVYVPVEEILAVRWQDAAGEKRSAGMR
jgi:hypothetical protein